MNLFKKCTILGFGLIFSASISYSQNNLIPKDPSVKIGKLSNGMTYYIKANKKPEKRAELRLVIHAGSVNEDNDQKGLAHLNEHMAFNGTKSFPKSAIVDYIESIGMQFGADLNAYTNFDETVYKLKVPTDNGETLNKGFQILQEWAGFVTDEDVEINKERGVVIEEERSRRGARDRIWKKQIDVYFNGSKYAERDVIGDTAIIANAPCDVVKRFYRDWYRPDLMAVVAVGDFKVEDIEKIIKEKFSILVNPANERKHEIYPVPTNQEILASVEKDKELAMSSISIMFLHPHKDLLTLSDLRESTVRDLANSLVSMRLNEYRSKENPPFLYAGMGYSNLAGDKDALSIMAMPKSESINAAYEIVLKELFSAEQAGFNQSELDRIKADGIRSLEQEVLEQDKTESEPLSSTYVYNFINHIPMSSPQQSLDFAKQAYSTITLAEVNAEISKMITEDGIKILFSVPESIADAPTKESVIAKFTAMKNAKYDKYVDNVLTTPLFNKEVKAGKIVNRKEKKNPDYTELTLSNGAKVILKKTDFKNDEIKFQAISKGGTSTFDNKDLENAEYATTIVDRSGLGDYDNNMLTKYLTGKIAWVGAGISQNYEDLNGSCSPKDLELFMQMINMKFDAPRVDSNAFKSSMQLIESRIKDMQNNPESAFYDSVRVNMCNHNFRGLPETIENLKTIDFKAALDAYHNRFTDASDFTFIFVGSFDEKTLEPAIEKYIASIPSINRKENWIDRKIEKPSTKLEKEYKIGVDYKSSIYLNFWGDFKNTIENRVKMNALANSLDIRLREVIREDKSGTYGAYSYVSMDRIPKEQYDIVIGWGCKPDRVNELYGDCMDIVKELKDKPLADTYIEKYKETMKRELETNMKENEFWIDKLGDYAFYGIDPNYLNSYLDAVNKVTSKDVQETAQKYFNYDKMAKFVKVPTDK